MAKRDKNLWRVAIDQSAAGETTLVAAAPGQVHAVLGFLLIPDADGTAAIQSDTVPGGAGTETVHTGVMNIKAGVPVGFRSEGDEPCLVGLAGEALVLETGTATVSGFAYGYTEGA